MKKIIFIICLFLFSPFIVNAVNYDITNFIVESYIKENGDLEVKELIVMDGSFNGYERDIVYTNKNLTYSESFANNAIYNATGIEDVEIKAKYVNDVSFDTFNENFDTFTKVSSAYSGDKAKYIESKLSNGYRYRMYYVSNNKKVAFYIHYTIKDVVVLHNDVAELYWTFIPNGFEDDLKNIEIKVYLPREDTSNNFRIWAHGNLIGEINFINNNGIYAYISKAIPGESVDIRTTFDKSMINNNVTKKSNQDALNRIIAIETKNAEDANRLRTTLLRKYNIVKYSSITLTVSMIILAIYIHFKYGKDPKSNFYSKYNREFIDDYNVEVIDYLMNRKITSNAMSASIMNLVYKKNIKVEEISNEKKKKKEYKFTLENEDNINESEKILIEFLFEKVGKNIDNVKEFTTIDLHNYANGTKTCNTFINSYTKWKNNVLELGKKEQFYESSDKPKIMGAIIIVLSFIIAFYSSNVGSDYNLAYINIILAIIFLTYSLAVHQKTAKGSLHYAKWKAFKRFLDDFGSFELKELPEIVLWERYLVYATIFGLADKVQKVMNVKIKELDVSDINYHPYFYYYNLGPTINHSVNNAISSAYSRQSANYANSHSSSSSGGGFGGGFSSGGGFGGGGGGGRGF